MSCFIVACVTTPEQDKSGELFQLDSAVANGHGYLTYYQEFPTVYDAKQHFSALGYELEQESLIRSKEMEIGALTAEILNGKEAKEFLRDYGLLTSRSRQVSDSFHAPA